MKNSNQERMETWKVNSPEEYGFHEVIIPENSDCKVANIFRLNLKKGDNYILNSNKLELHAVLIEGEAVLSEHASLKNKMNKFDSFYIPSKDKIKITAIEDSIFYIAGALCEGIGKPIFRKFDSSLPIGDIHQIHGEGVGRREVMFTLAPSDKASRLICGLTWGGNGAWTSWPPHQHEKDLEEVYCYFDMPAPKFGLHISYLKSGQVDEIVSHVVQSGTMVQAPCGYHPTVASPGTRNTYLWVLAAFVPEGRSYDLAIMDPNYIESKK
ncbi:5-deoxy-glucuronate isomerase [Fusobacterium sp. DD29]|uniref:5-deoxy-glucuronate isomerase n=1 Tax=unclassified Fusobacterium TaxID=2648384 RepID=UPI001B8B069F|nr:MULTISPECIES: 5-deoxy-glucuronate isomerase [unclassified Fusobacterium]MBR8749502.1 5-deoxy-glucuronate isomerase [Fusobacterium sp. DD29]MBR8761763.1 5-deoxy-glucuronate isomerase [Fusobacterium sp. DD25]MBR8767781.1 5-deoxy-glucuronate isomerase [Fusobacterium sp. DD43]MBR8771798.1 5-deoxy-glucuronate isomerase [Fusobacterium sp. DD40]MBR8776057.1 5-deoxy-glucuronate isomerase [Fusobacterium sp. DD17]